MRKHTGARITALFLLTFLLIAAFCSCNPSTDIGEIDDLASLFLDKLIADDRDGAYDLVKQTVKSEDFVQYWSLMRVPAQGAKAYELEQIGWNVKISNGVSTKIAAFTVSFDTGRTMFFRITTLEGVEGIAGVSFHETTEFVSKTSAAVSVGNVISTVLFLLLTAFTVWMLVDCIRRRINKKALWIFIILIGATVSLTVGEKTGINFGIGIFTNVPKIVADPSILSMIFKLYLPLGAIVYFFSRKKLTAAAAPEAPAADNVPEIVIPEQPAESEKTEQTTHTEQ